MPIDFYGKAIQKILMFSPTTHMIYAPTLIFTRFDVQTAVATITMQLVMFAILMVSTIVLYRKGVKKINVNGG